MNTLRRAMPHQLKSFRTPHPDAFSSREQAAAWTISARCRAAIYRQRFWYSHSGDVALNLDLHTWVLGPPQRSGACFATWFANNGPDYRVVLHGTPRSWANRKIPAAPWSVAYHRQPLPLDRSRHFTPEQHSTAQLFLDRAFAAYRDGAEAVGNLIRRAGHVYWFSDGAPSRL
jgi:hypothetical protein